MNLIIVGGFLGSGKTTILLSVARYLSNNNMLRVAIIENEIGKVGIDGEHLKEEGLQVKEIYSGCICCSLRNDIIQTLLSLEREYNPDVVLLEPSGVANPSEVVRCLDGYGGEIQQKIVITVVDSARFNQIEDYSLPIITNSIDLANIVVINKIDLVRETEIIEIEEKIKKINSLAKIIHTSEAQESTLNELNKTIVLPIKPEKTSFRIAPAEQPAKMHEKATTFAKELDLQFPDHISNMEIELRLSTFLKHISYELERNDCKLVGHLKVILKAQNKGYLMMSKTSFNQLPQSKGKLSKSISEAKLTINLIVYGITEKQLSMIAENAIVEELNLATDTIMRFA